MPRTVEQIDSELQHAVLLRRHSRDQLQKDITPSERTTLMVRIQLANERIETLLDERSRVRTLDELSQL